MQLVRAGVKLSQLELTGRNYNHEKTITGKIQKSVSHINLSCCIRYTLRVKKGCHPNYGYNFVNSWWICKILSLLERPVNFQQNRY